MGRSNVGKSSLINALVRQKIARTSAAPGKTRLANIYRVARGSGEPLYLVDLPGYGYARGGPGEFAQLVGDYFRSARGHAGAPSAATALKKVGALLLVDSRHPGLESDLEAWAWLRDTVDAAAIVATKIDKLARGQRIRAMRELESVFEHPVLPVSAVTGEGLDELWTLIDNLTNNRNNRSSRKPTRKSSPNSPNRLPKATAARLLTEAPRLPKRAPRPPKR